MADRIIFGNTLLKGINKAGILKPDADGYYPVVLGALGVENSNGEIYVNTSIARATFEGNGTLMGRVARGTLKGEMAHPDPADSPNAVMFLRRVRTIKEDRVSHHIRKIWLQEIDYQGRKVLGIMGELKPVGPYGKILKEALDNKDENVCFSGRYFSNLSRQGGVMCREIHTCVTWDWVSEPGIEMANKYASPSLESANDHPVLQQVLEQEIVHEKANQELTASLESSGGYTAEALYRDLGFRQESKEQKLPASSRW